MCFTISNHRLLLKFHAELNDKANEKTTLHLRIEFTSTASVY